MKTVHCHVDVKGLLSNRTTRQMGSMLTDLTGRKLTGEEAKAALLDELGRGHLVLPTCHPDECPNFDFAGAGCPGHETGEAQGGEHGSD